jgi:hypothetical protein
MILLAVILSPLPLAWYALVPHGQHKADSQAQADWYAPTPMPELAPLPDWQPRYIPDVVTPADRVRQFYDTVELDIAVAIDRTIAWSRHNFEASNA